MKRISRCSLRKMFVVYHIQERKQILELVPMNHMSEYILDRKCLHIISPGKD